MSETLQFQIALTMASHVGAVTAKTLVSYCGGADAVFRTGKRALLRIPGIGPATVEGLAAPDLLLKAEKECRWIERHGITALFYTDPGYPFRLKQNADCPALLYCKVSDIDLLNAARLVGIVGTRTPTEYGRAICEEYVEALLPYGVVVLSGLAFGIDGIAHRRSNALGIPNLGALGHGLAAIYPREHAEVARKMTENGGLITEYPHDTKPDKEHFPMRNRIIAGMSDALLVVETAESGGSMITAELAAQYDRDVFAVPGRVRDAKSAGCNRLIRQNKARLTTSVADLAEAMGWEVAGKRKPQQARLFVELSPEESALMEVLQKRPETGIDELSYDVALAPGRIAALLLELEFKGLVRTLPGKRYRAADR
ncbi:MAG: DNA-processing protein DprA [Saprospiraceae bacterium]|nr:DNA-processing protein DprA [Saprospiraceae bacterium]